MVNLSIRVGSIPSAAVVQPMGQPAGMWAPILVDEFTGPKTVTDATEGMVNFGGPTYRAWYPTGGGWASQANGSHTNNPDREKEYYDASGLSVSGGILSLTAYANAQGGVPYTSGLIQTNPSCNFKYGYVEARIKTPQVASSWPAFWMIASDLVWPPEVDIMEQQGSGSSRLSYSVYADGQSTVTNNSLSSIDLTQWHTWGLKWNATSLTFYIDGVQIGTVTDVAKVPQRNMYVVLNQAVDGLQTINAGNYPVAMQVEFLHIYQLA